MELELEARLRALAAFARQRSFAGAAAELFISQPAVSKHIAELERYLGLQLVVRQPRGSELTPAGHYLAEHILHAEALLAQAARGLVAFSDPGFAPLSLATSGTPGTYILPRTLAAFRMIYPSVKTELFFGSSTQALDAVRSHRAEMGLVGGLTAASEIAVEPLLDDRVVLIGSTQFAGRRWDLRELDEYTWISREEGSATRAAVDATCDRLGMTRPSRLELPSWEAIKLAVAAGAGIAACSHLALEVELKAGTLVIIDVPRWDLRRAISVITMADTPLTPAAERFLELLRQHWRSA